MNSGSATCRTPGRGSGMPWPGECATVRCGRRAVAASPCRCLKLAGDRWRRVASGDCLRRLPSTRTSTRLTNGDKRWQQGCVPDAESQPLRAAQASSLHRHDAQVRLRPPQRPGAYRSLAATMHSANRLGSQKITYITPTTNTTQQVLPEQMAGTRN